MICYVAESSSEGVKAIAQLNEIDNDFVPLDDAGIGFEWGYEGAGPRNLAHAILAHYAAEAFATDFMMEVISKKSPIELRERAVVFREENILVWLRKKLNERCASLGI